MRRSPSRVRPRRRSSVRPRLGPTQIATPVRLADHVTDAPREDGVAVVARLAGSHRSVAFDNRRAKVLRRRAELVHSYVLSTQSLQHLRRLPGIIPGTYNVEPAA